MTNTSTVLANLMAVIEDRKRNPPDRSYTTSLFAGGVEMIGAKITEESAEVVEAAAEEGDEGRAHLIYEAGDLVAQEAHLRKEQATLRVAVRRLRDPERLERLARQRGFGPPVRVLNLAAADEDGP